MANGRREAASHYTPLIGHYDSNDPDVLECQVLLMKYAGIDGVIIDWHGTDDYLDYGIVHRNTLRVIEAIEKAGLHYAICYEDRSIPNLIVGKKLTAADAMPHGAGLLQWMQEHWFADNADLKQDGWPVFQRNGEGGVFTAPDCEAGAGCQARLHIRSYPDHPRAAVLPDALP